MKKAILFKKEKNAVRCLACAHKCLIQEGKTGICGVRKNIKNSLYLLVYGLPCAVHIDPIEKKPLYHFMPNTRTFSIGTVGCNFRCKFCQNFDISQIAKTKILGSALTPKQVVEQALKNNCPSISYTYNEPSIFIEYVKDTAKLAKKHNIRNIMVTNGYMSIESFNFVKDYIDAMNIDLKSFSEDFYHNLSGASLAPVLETIKRAHKAKIHIEITTLLIPGENDTKEEIEKIAKFIASVSPSIPWHISRFFPMYKMQDKSSTSHDSLKLAEQIGKKYLKYVYLGNV